MKIYLDESGDFRTEGAAEAELAIVTGVAVPSSDEASLLTGFEAIRASVGPQPNRRGEVKSKDWSESDRRRLCKLIDSLPRVIVGSVILELRDFQGTALRPIREEFRAGLERMEAAAFQESLRKENRDLIARHEKLSDVQFVRLYGWAQCIDRLLREAAFNVVPPEERESWRHLEIVVDGPPESAERREGLFFRIAVQNWLVMWSHRQRFGTLAKNGEQHPLLEFWGLSGTIDVERIINDGLRFRGSDTEAGIQIADIAAAIVRRAAQSRGKNEEALYTYGWLMKSSPQTLGNGIGLVTPHAQRGGRFAAEHMDLIREYTLAQTRRQSDVTGAPLLLAPPFGEIPGALV